MRLEFYESNLCRSGAFCPTCRDMEGGRRNREQLARAYELPADAPDFACPEGVPWGGACRRCWGKHPVEQCPIEETLEEAARRLKAGGCCGKPSVADGTL